MYVTPLSFPLNDHGCNLFQGIFDLEGKPLHPEGIAISSNAQRTNNARMDTSSIAMIELRLSTIPKQGTVARVFEAAVEGYFVGSPHQMFACPSPISAFTSNDLWLSLECANTCACRIAALFRLPAPLV
jgi:hypothetical protein